MKPSLSHSEASATSTVSSLDSQGAPLTPFRWLLLLGFPPAIAAHILAPDVFSADCA